MGWLQRAVSKPATRLPRVAASYVLKALTCVRPETSRTSRENIRVAVTICELPEGLQDPNAAFVLKPDLDEILEDRSDSTDVSNQIRGVDNWNGADALISTH
jgi:hypothetical protein